MRKRSRTEASTSKPSAEKDANQSAFEVLQQLLARIEGTPGKNPLAVALGRMGGLKGGKARAKKLSAAQLRRSAKRAANARWRRTKRR